LPADGGRIFDQVSTFSTVARSPRPASGGGAEGTHPRGEAELRDDIELADQA
jgi:hypothetical protein